MQLFIKKIIKKGVNFLGYDLVALDYLKKIKKNIIPSSLQRLEHVKDLGFEPKVIYDCGAFIGRWAKEVNNIYPHATIIMIEPNYELNESINENVKHFIHNIKLLNVAVSDKQGEAELNIWENSRHANKMTSLAASSLLNHVQGPSSKKITVKTKTIDSIIKEINYAPDLLKLDLQGNEKSALLGSKNALLNAEMVVVEFGCLDAYKNRTTPRELIDIFYGYDYSLYDIVDLRYRPYDGALVGGDFFFVKNSSKLKNYKNYF